MDRFPGSPVPLNTPELIMIPASARLSRAEAADPRGLGVLLGASVPENWPPVMMLDVIDYHARLLAGDPSLAGWLSWYWILKNSAAGRPVLIGTGGFHGRPSPDGTVEIGYALLPLYQGRGLAAEAVSALLDWVFTRREVARVIARTYPELIPSIRLLQKMGFRRVAREPGPTLVFELPRASRLEQTAA